MYTLNLRKFFNFGLILTLAFVLEATSDVAAEEFLRLMPHNKLIVKSEGDPFAMACIPSTEEFDLHQEGYEIYWSHPVHGRMERTKFRDRGRSVFVNNVKSENKLMLSFHPVMRDDGGNWTCTAVNTDGEEVRKSFLFEVIAPTRFDDQFVSMTINETEEAFLPCDPNGNPKPNVVQWEFEESTIEKDSMSDIEIIEDGLLLKNVIVDMEGTYKCKVHQVTNTVSNTAEKTFNVIVNYAPIIETQNKTVYGMLHSEIKLSCRASARPNPDFLWYHGNRHITENTINDIENSTLTIHLDSVHKFGIYNCKVRNAFGVSRVFFHVHEGRLPEVPDTFRLLGKSTMSLDIEIGAKKDERFPVLGYRFELIAKEDFEDAQETWNNSKIHDVFNRTHEISNVIIHGLTKDTTYMVRAAARNVLGLSDWTKVEEFATLMNFDHEASKPHDEDKKPADKEIKKIEQKTQQSTKPERPTTTPRIITITESSSGHALIASVTAILTGSLVIVIRLCGSQW